MVSPLDTGAGLAAAASWGAGDFFGGVATRRARVWRVVAVSQGIGVVLTAILVLALREPAPVARELALAVAAGGSGALGIVALYAALARGHMGVVAPITAVIGAALPVVVGIGLEGSPDAFALAGFALALPGIFLLSRGVGRPSTAALLLALASGVGFGGFFVLIAQASSAGSLAWPLMAARLATFGSASAVFVATRRAGEPTPWAHALLAGVGDTLGNAFFVLAARLGRLDVAAVLASLYPAVTVLFARFTLHERLARGQWVGLALTLAAIALIAL